MRKFISMVYYEGRILGFTEDGDCWMFDPRSPMSGGSTHPVWTLLCYGPFGS